jgi:hypothetical protein
MGHISGNYGDDLGAGFAPVIAFVFFALALTLLCAV